MRSVQCVGSLVAAGNEGHSSCDLLALSVLVGQEESRAESSSWAVLVLQTPFPATVSISCSIDWAAQLCVISRICQQSPAFVLRLWRNTVTKITLQSSCRGALLVDCLLVNNSLFSFSHYSLSFSTFFCITF